MNVKSENKEEGMDSWGRPFYKTGVRGKGLLMVHFFTF